MKTLFVTGGAQGIGRATAELFHQQGWFVGVGDVDEAGAMAVAQGLKERAFACRLDVTEPGAAEAALAAFAKAAGGVDAVFNNAGVLCMGAFDAMDQHKTLRMLDVNVRGVVLTARAALPHLKARRGTLVQMGSASGIYGTADIAVYSATKFFVRGLTEALDVELAGSGVRVVDIMPGFVDTAMVRRDQQGSTAVAKLGVHLGAGDIAAAVWRAVGGAGGVHVIPELRIRLFAVVAGLSGRLGRFIIRHQGR